MTMPITQEPEWTQRSLETPFADVESEGPRAAVESASAAWDPSFAPFAEDAALSLPESETQQLFAEALAELYDEQFDEAVARLAEETEQAVAERFVGEAAHAGGERERYGEQRLSSVRFEAEQYLHALEAGLSSADVQSLAEEQLDTLLESFDPEPGEHTPAGEEFIGKLVNKAKKVVKVVGKVAKTVGKLATPLLGPVLAKLRGLVQPLLRRVLSFAIGKLPAPLQPAARQIASRFTAERDEQESFDEAPASPTQLSDVELLTESFDVVLAEAITSPEALTGELERFASGEEEEPDGRQLERLAEQRGVLIDSLREADAEQDLTPVIEQFVPALLAALRLGIKLAGRPKVVSFLAKYLAQLIGKWVKPELAQPLSSAIVDTGLRLVSLEAESEAEQLADDAAPVALASVIEDTVRRVAEHEDYVFEDEALTQLAAAEALNEAVATHFPPRFVRPSLQQAPSLGGTFVARSPRRTRTYRKYSRVPEIELTPQIADALPTFGGSTVGAALRAAGAQLPFRARVHIYQAATGTTLPRMLRLDRPAASRAQLDARQVHPLTVGAAGLLLREPRLGVEAPARFLRSRQRIAVGQRFYLLEPLGAASVALPLSAMQGETAQTAPSRAWTSINARRGRVTVSLYLSESEAQQVAEGIRQGRGTLGLLQALSALLKGAGEPPRAAAATTQEDHEDAAGGARGKRALPAPVAAALHRRLTGWVLPALSSWVRSNAEAFVRAAAHPQPGVTVRVQLSAVPGLELTGSVQRALGRKPRGARSSARPQVTITLSPKA